MLCNSSSENGNLKFALFGYFTPTESKGSRETTTMTEGLYEALGQNADKDTCKLR